MVSIFRSTSKLDGIISYSENPRFDETDDAAEDAKLLLWDKVLLWVSLNDDLDLCCSLDDPAALRFLAGDEDDVVGFDDMVGGLLFGCGSCGFCGCLDKNGCFIGRGR